MPLFTYQAVDRKGRTVNGELEASDRKKLLQALMGEGLRPVKISSGNDASSSRMEETETKDYFASSKRFRMPFRPARSKSVLAIEFLKRLLMLLSAGMAIGDAVSLLTRRIKDPQLQGLCSDVWKFLSEGRTLASAMRTHKGLFSDSTIQLVEAGETSGNLVPVLQRVVNYLEESRAVKSKLINNLLYPVFILCFAVFVVIILLTFLLPKIRGMLDQLGGELPLITRLLIDGSDALILYGPFIILAIIAIVVFIKQWRKTGAGQMKSDGWLLQIPLIGKIYLYASIFSTTNLMATLLGSGVNTTETLRLVEKTIPNQILRGKFSAARKQIQEGVSMVSAIQSVHYMPDVAMDIMTVGESTGNLVKSLEDINQIYKDELTKSLNFLTTATIAIALGSAIILVGIIALSVIYSIMSVSQSLQM